MVVFNASFLVKYNQAHVTITPQHQTMEKLAQIYIRFILAKDETANFELKDEAFHSKMLIWKILFN